MDQLYLVLFPDRQRHYLRDPLGGRIGFNLGLLDFVLAELQLHFPPLSSSLQRKLAVRGARTLRREAVNEVNPSRESGDSALVKIEQQLELKSKN